MTLKATNGVATAIVFSVVALTAIWGTAGVAQAGPLRNMNVEIGIGGQPSIDVHYNGRRHYHGGSRYYSRCGWLRRKARRTGSQFWWRRYNRCMDGMPIRWNSCRWLRSEAIITGNPYWFRQYRRCMRRHRY